MTTIVSPAERPPAPRFTATGADPRSALTASVLGAVACDPRGVPLCGRSREYALLREAGACDASVGRLFEGHTNALQLVARFGTAAQHARATRDALAGRLFGVWNTQADEDGVRIVDSDAHRVELAGHKTFGSGAGRVSRALITASLGRGPTRMLLVPMDVVPAKIDLGSWQPFGMHDSESFSVAFDGVRVAHDATIGEPGDYETAPYFIGGASRFLAVQSGALERLVDELAAFLTARGRDADPIQLARFAECAVAVDGAVLWVNACVRAWKRFDDVPDDAIARLTRANELLAVVDSARVAVEAAALATLERAERIAGARGLLEPLPFARMIRDQRMYLRQPAPDAAVARSGRAALERSLARAAERARP